ncbi:pyridoxamine 5'-phosphate oxidase family protein [Paenibacillus nasutitermitis]|uniref:Pyridoxamine 5'-phosphate oxidase N-terminal domain-containing protein n=1 Tax=Paenibacillus nasutitermitis TaxID=1652958 RepID=A0A916ZFH2_9BACL|nr:pyridoxamine 5'-phosphate oxidase family protein [Paenibacillus nasutitermitis]GGD94038.1 hypothetical protein GCM10010911_60920 [Paenibacillus nasutitermitis]
MAAIEKQKLEQRITAALDKHHFGSFSTVENNKPKSRYMAIFHDGMNVYLATDRKTHKVEELQHNSNISLLLGFDGKSWAEIVEIEGTASITKDESLRQKFWNDQLKPWFNGPDDPDYVILEIDAERIQYSDEEVKEQVWEK